MSVTCVVGGQFGSEGKGLIVGEIAKDYGMHVRVGAANAGHTLYTNPTFRNSETTYNSGRWEKHVMQQIPCAAYANPVARLAIGPGALISPEILEEELERWVAWREAQGLPEMAVWVDPRAHIVTQEHVNREAASDLMERIGSTSTTAREGIGAATAARVMREAGCVQAKDYFDSGFGHWDLVKLRNVPTDIHQYQKYGGKVLLEGTQGYGLSLTTGQFPYVTSRNTTSAGLCADCGVPPTAVDRVILVCRTYPIRVAGNSGPFAGGAREIRWEDIDVDGETERTTVTKKIRRVATFSTEQVRKAAMVNGATEIALTFCDYLYPECTGRTEWNAREVVGRDIAKVFARIDDIEQATGLPVTMLGTGPHSIIRRTA